MLAGAPSSTCSWKSRDQHDFVASVAVEVVNLERRVVGEQAVASDSGRPCCHSTLPSSVTAVRQLM